MCSCPVIPASLVEETIFFSITYFCLICHRSVDWMCMGLFLGSLFCSVDLCVCFSALGCQIFHGWTFIWLNRGFTVLLGKGSLKKVSFSLGFCNVLYPKCLVIVPWSYSFHSVENSEITAKPCSFIMGCIGFLLLITIFFVSFHNVSFYTELSSSIMFSILWKLTYPKFTIYNACSLIFYLLSYHQKNFPKGIFRLCVFINLL